MRKLFNFSFQSIWTLETGWIFTKFWLWFLIPLFPQVPQLHVIPAIGLTLVLQFPFLGFVLTRKLLLGENDPVFTLEEKDKADAWRLSESVKNTHFHLAKILILGPMLLLMGWVYHFMIVHGIVGP